MDFTCPSCKQKIEDERVPSMLFHGMCDTCIMKAIEEAKENGIIIEY